MKLCLCHDLHQKASNLPLIDGRHRCEKCRQPWISMKEAKADSMGRFMSGDVVLHFRDGHVNLIDVGEPLKATYVYPRTVR